MHLAYYYASLEGLNFREILSLWNEETILEKSYTGFNVASKQKLSISIMDFGFASILGLQLWFFIWNKKRNNRIVSELIECGSITEKQLSV